MKLDLNSYVIYPSHGIGKIVDILNEDSGVIYKINLVDSDMVFQVPRDSVEKIAIRKIIDPKLIKEVIDSLAVFPKDIESNWKKRINLHLIKMKSGKIEDSIYVIKDLFIKNNIKPLSIVEKGRFEVSLGMLIKEIVLASQENEKIVTELVHSQLNKLKKNIKIK